MAPGTASSNDAAASPSPAAFAPLRLALKYVSYLDPAGNPVATSDAIRSALKSVNEIYSACQIEFTLEEYSEVLPSHAGLPFQPTQLRDLTPIRRQFQNGSQLLVVGTGKWKREKNGLGSDGANAWTMMPGEKDEGSILEADVASNAGLIAHELGHYLNLDHHNDPANLMNPVIYRRSRVLSAEQCQQMRETALSYRAGALRGTVPHSPTLSRNLAGGPQPQQAGDRR